MNLEEYKKNLLHLKDNRKHKVRNSYGIYDGYKYYRKIKPKDKKYILTESQYFSITRKINKLLADKLSLGEDIILPFRLGKLEIRKYDSSIEWDGEKIKTNLPINWDKTIKLWYEDSEAREKKKFIRDEEKEIYRIYYNKLNAIYNNKSFYEFKFNRELKLKLKNNIKENKTFAFKFR